MLINVHAHLFTLRTILSREAIRVITQRIEDKGFPGFFVEAVESLLDDLLDKPQYLDERELLGKLFAKLMEVTSFNDFLDDKMAGLPITVTLRAGAVEDLPVDVLRRALDSITSSLDDGSQVGKSLFDIIATIRLAMRSTITEVADELLEQMDPDDALVALMLDIRGPDDPERDRKNFLRQIDGTEEAALQRPGRVLPFFAVHPDRPDHFELLTNAIEHRGFVGVKLYPSLGYRVDHPSLMAVYRYCLEKDVPVLLHCGHSGFYRKTEFIDYCNPDNWLPVLQGELADLRVCFAHFGGWQSLGRPDGLDAGSWGATILQLMHDLPNVYTDLAYHTDQMANREDEQHYYTKLAEMLQDPKLRRRILYGTDSWLLRMDLVEKVYEQYFRHHMTVEDFDKIAELAPKEFLGFPSATAGTLRPNLQRYVDHMTAHREKVGAEPAAWLQDIVGQTFVAARPAPDWSLRREPVAYTYQGLGDLMSTAQKHKGFKVNRTLKLKELAYYAPRDPNFGFICEDRARKFLQFAGRFGTYRGTHDDTSSVNLFTEVFRKGDKQFVEVAALLDSVFEYERGLA